MQKGILFVLSSPSGGGKTTIRKIITKELENLVCSISYTTRDPRHDEKNGIDYNFISKKEFQRRLENGEFIEHANVFGNYYGTSKRYINKFLNQGKDVLLTIDVQGAMQIKKNTNSVLIFVIPPTLDTLKERLMERNTDNIKEIQNRLKEAKKELMYMNEYDYIVVNDNIKNAVEKIRAIVISERCNTI